MAKLVIKPIPEKEIKEEKIYVPQENNKGNVRFSFDASIIEIALKFYKWNGNIKTSTKASVKIVRKTKVSDSDFIEETLVEGIGKDVLVRDEHVFPHKYEIIIYTDSVEIVGVVRRA